MPEYLAHGLYLPICPHCDWEGAPRRDPLRALGDAEVHIALAHKHHHSDDNEPVGIFAEALRDRDEAESEPDWRDMKL